MDDAALLRELEAFRAATDRPALNDRQRAMLARGLYCLKDRAKSFPELLEKAAFILRDRPLEPEPRALAALTPVSRSILSQLTPRLQNASWTREALEETVGAVAGEHGLGLGKIAAPLRAALSGRSVSPSVFDMMLVIGRDETIARLAEAAAWPEAG